MVVSESSKSKNLEIGLTKFEDIAKIFSSSNVIPFQTSTINFLLKKKKSWSFLRLVSAENMTHSQLIPAVAATYGYTKI
jgi:hypothetical protein